MANPPKARKPDLKSRLGLKSRSSLPPARPIVPGAPPPEPVKPKVEKPTEESIAEARRRAAEAEAAAGPAVEQFQIAAPEHTPLPAPIPAAPRIEYVEVKGSEELPDAARKRRRMLIMVGVGAGLVAFVVGNMMGRSSVRSSINDSVMLEAQEKRALFDEKQGTFEKIAVVKAALERIEQSIRLLDPEQGDITTLEKEFADLIGAMSDFANHKQASLDPDEVLGSNVVNGALMKELAAFAFKTKSFHMSVKAAVEEAQAMFAAMPSPANNELYAVSEPGKIEVPGLGEIPISKGTLLVNWGAPEAVQTRDSSGSPVTEYYQKVLLHGRDKPLQINTKQMVQVDMGPRLAKATKDTKRKILTRLAEIAATLLEQVNEIDVKEVKASIQKVLDG